MTIKKIVLVFFALLVAELVALGVVLSLVISSQQDLAKIENLRYRAFKIADELRQSSDDLTRMARTYVSTGNPVFEAHFRDILDIRDGKKARPANYGLVYWDLVVAGNDVPGDPLTAISLDAKMEGLNLSAEELEMLQVAKSNSDDLVLIEAKAMNAVKGIFNEGGELVQRAPDFELARTLMFGADYHTAKAAIMKPVNRFLASLEDRMNTAVDDQRSFLSQQQFLAAVLLLLTLATFVFFAVAIRNRVIGPVNLLVAQSKAIAQGEYGHQTKFHSNDEIGILATTLNRMSDAIADDVTERQAGENALRRSESRLSTILEDSPVGIAIGRKSDGAAVFANSRMIEQFGMTKEQYLATPVDEHYVRKQDLELIFEQLEQEGRVIGAEALKKRRDGSEFWGSISIVPYDDKDESGWIVFHDDVTERRIAKENLRQSEARFRAVIDNSPSEIVIKDTDLNYVRVNRIFEEHYGVSNDDIVGKSARNFLPMSMVEPIEAQDRQVMATGKATELELETIVDGEPRYNLESKFPIRDDDENTIGIAGIAADITEKKSAERELLAAKEQAETALGELKQTQARLVTTEKLASLGQLTAGIAHEIKNPLNFVNNFSETSVELLDELKEVVEPIEHHLGEEERDELNDIVETLKGDLQKIHHHGSRADGIVKSMLLHARGDSSDHVPTAVNGLVDEALQLAYHGERARDKSFQVTLDQDYGDDVGEAEIVPQDITRVLVNLLSNAFYAIKQRTVVETSKDYVPTVSVTTSTKDSNLEIRIRDNGTGMPTTVRDKLFEPFFTTKPTGEGTGLGLSMCFDIVVQQHGGNITVDSKPDAFTEFVVTLPRGGERSKPNSQPRQSA